MRDREINCLNTEGGEDGRAEDDDKEGVGHLGEDIVGNKSVGVRRVGGRWVGWRDRPGKGRGSA